jgi:hypothetical protein
LPLDAIGPVVSLFSLASPIIEGSCTSPIPRQQLLKGVLDFQIIGFASQCDEIEEGSCARGSRGRRPR